MTGRAATLPGRALLRHRRRRRRRARRLPASTRRRRAGDPVGDPVARLSRPVPGRRHRRGRGDSVTSLRGCGPRRQPDRPLQRGRHVNSPCPAERRTCRTTASQPQAPQLSSDTLLGLQQIPVRTSEAVTKPGLGARLLRQRMFRDLRPIAGQFTYSEHHRRQTPPLESGWLPRSSSMRS